MAKIFMKKPEFKNLATVPLRALAYGLKKSENGVNRRVHGCCSVRSTEEGTHRPL